MAFTNLEIITMEAVKSASRAIVNHIDSTHNIDRIWEQRRYEIARDMFVRYVPKQATPAQCVQLADELIAELRKAK